jgi:hypothetical protein
MLRRVFTQTLLAFEHGVADVSSSKFASHSHTALFILYNLLLTEIAQCSAVTRRLLRLHLLCC